MARSGEWIWIWFDGKIGCDFAENAHPQQPNRSVPISTSTLDGSVAKPEPVLDQSKTSCFLDSLLNLCHVQSCQSNQDFVWFYAIVQPCPWLPRHSSDDIQNGKDGDHLKETVTSMLEFWKMQRVPSAKNARRVRFQCLFWTIHPNHSEPNFKSNPFPGPGPLHTART